MINLHESDAFIPIGYLEDVSFFAVNVGGLGSCRSATCAGFAVRGRGIL